MESFVSAFNSTIDTIGTYTKFNPETMAKGVLFANGSVSMVRSRMMNMILNAVDVTGTYTRLSQVGFSIGSNNTLTFDEDVFRQAYAAAPSDVIALFTTAAETTEVTQNGQTVTQEVDGTGGIGPVLESILDALTDDYDGFISYVTDGLDTQTQMLNDRVDHLNDLLAAKRTRLEKQFAAMETALAGLQGQQNALTSLSQLASSFSGRSTA